MGRSERSLSRANTAVDRFRRGAGRVLFSSRTSSILHGLNFASLTICGGIPSLDTYEPFDRRKVGIVSRFRDAKNRLGMRIEDHVMLKLEEIAPGIRALRELAGGENSSSEKHIYNTQENQARLRKIIDSPDVTQEQLEQIICFEIKELKRTGRIELCSN